MQLQHFDGDKCTTRFSPSAKKVQKRQQNNFINDENHVTLKGEILPLPSVGRDGREIVLMTGISRIIK